MPVVSCKCCFSTGEEHGLHGVNQVVSANKSNIIKAEDGQPKDAEAEAEEASEAWRRCELRLALSLAYFSLLTLTLLSLVSLSVSSRIPPNR